MKIKKEPNKKQTNKNWQGWGEEGKLYNNDLLFGTKFSAELRTFQRSGQVWPHFE